MKNKNVFQTNSSDFKKELKTVVKNSFEEMLQDVVRGRLSIQDFTNKINYNYSQKKIELQGSLF